MMLESLNLVKWMLESLNLVKRMLESLNLVKIMLESLNLVKIMLESLNSVKLNAGVLKLNPSRHNGCRKKMALYNEMQYEWGFYFSKFMRKVKLGQCIQVYRIFLARSKCFSVAKGTWGFVARIVVSYSVSYSSLFLDYAWIIILHAFF